MMNHHTIPKFGFGPYKSSSTGVGSFFLPKILTNPTDRNCPGAEAVAAAGPSSSKVALEQTRFTASRGRSHPQRHRSHSLVTVVVHREVHGRSASAVCREAPGSSDFSNIYLPLDSSW
uniref:(northern house mosquito) hypothetical protein n=1 Tax=Culex pipiens TaxID=7175 RepID=A0A8D8N6B0_CULPI